MVTGDGYPSDEDPIAVKNNAFDRVRRCKKRFIASSVCFLLSCASVIPFSKGHSLYVYAEPVGRLLVYLSLAFFVVFLYCGLLWWGARSMYKDLDTSQET